MLLDTMSSIRDIARMSSLPDIGGPVAFPHHLSPYPRAMPPSITLDEIHAASESDAMLWDIYALATTAAEWRAFVAAALASPWPTKLRIGDAPTRDVDAAVHAMEDDAMQRDGLRPFLRLGPPGAALHCYFFGCDEIELDVDRREIVPENFDDLLRFLRLLGDTVDRNVVVADEGSPTYGIFAYRPELRGFQMLRRPSQPGVLAREIGNSLADVLAPFRQFAHAESEHSVPADPAAMEAAARWRALYTPDRLAWHTELTACEFSALRSLDVAINIFFGPRSFADLCALGGFTPSALRWQFRESIRHADEVFAHSTSGTCTETARHDSGDL